MIFQFVLNHNHLLLFFVVVHFYVKYTHLENKIIYLLVLLNHKEIQPDPDLLQAGHKFTSYSQKMFTFFIIIFIIILHLLTQKN